jgi:hypothetical protein
MLGEMVLTAWERISGELVVTGFKNCCTYNALHSTEDELLWQDKKTVTVKKIVVMNTKMKSKVRTRTLNNNPSSQRIL